MSLIVLAALAYLVSPVLLICGWAQWVRQPKLRTATSILSLVGFVFANTSALLAIAAIAYAQIHRFPHQDPLLIKLSSGGSTFPMRNRFWNRWSLAVECVAMVRPTFCHFDACFLDAGRNE